MKAVILGATSGIGRAIARCLAERGDAVFLLGRSDVDLAKTAEDLGIRGARRVGHATCDLADPQTFVPALDRADAELSGFDTVILTAGLLGGDQAGLEEDPERCLEMMTINFSHSVLFAEEARRRLLSRGGGRLCLFSSVAGDRPRKPVVLYGATKAGLAYYADGLDHRFRGEGLRVLLVKPGFVHTPMTAGLEAPPFAGATRPVAERVVRALDRGSSVVYAPPIWRLVMIVIRLLPRAVMRRIGF